MSRRMGTDHVGCMSAFNSRMFAGLAAVAITLLPNLGSAQSRNLIALERRWQALDESEKYAEALPIAEMAVKLSEVERDAPNDSRHVESMERLSRLLGGILGRR